jgi:Uma2 family endonuclease
MSTTESALLTPAEYLEIESRSEVRHEYINGRMYEMPGSSARHSYIATNLLGALFNQTRDRSCRVFTCIALIKISATGMYTHADISALRGEAGFEHIGDVDSLLNPSVIIEILSPATESYDRGDKFEHYSRLESLQEYVLVSQHHMRVEQFVRDGADWRLSDLRDPEALLRLASIGCEIPLAEIYEGVEFPNIENSRWPG